MHGSVGMRCPINDIGVYQQAFVHNSYLVSNAKEDDGDVDHDEDEADNSWTHSLTVTSMQGKQSQDHDVPLFGFAACTE